MAPIVKASEEMVKGIGHKLKFIHFFVRICREIRRLAPVSLFDNRSVTYGLHCPSVLLGEECRLKGRTDRRVCIGSGSVRACTLEFAKVRAPTIPLRDSSLITNIYTIYQAKSLRQIGVRP
jgi:hypothetical protein